MDMKTYAELAAIIAQYPALVRNAFILWALLSVGLIWMLIAYYPSAPIFAFDFFRVARTTAGKLALEFGVRNRLAETALISKAHLSFFEKQEPTTGLQGQTSLTASYKVFQSESNVWKSADPSGLTENADLVYPFAEQPYAVLTVPLAQTVKAAETDRFVIVIDADDFPDPRQTTVQGSLEYNSGKRTDSRTASLK